MSLEEGGRRTSGGTDMRWRGIGVPVVVSVAATALVTGWRPGKEPAPAPVSARAHATLSPDRPWRPESLPGLDLDQALTLLASEARSGSPPRLRHSLHERIAALHAESVQKI